MKPNSLLLNMRVEVHNFRRREHLVVSCFHVVNSYLFLFRGLSKFMDMIIKMGIKLLVNINYYDHFYFEKKNTLSPNSKRNFQSIFVFCIKYL